MEEFFKQGDKEQEQGLDFSPLCDRQNTMVPQSQIGNWASARHIQILELDSVKTVGQKLKPLHTSHCSTEFITGFIDFIVAPTLAVCGDVITLVVGENADQDVQVSRNIKGYRKYIEPGETAFIDEIWN